MISLASWVAFDTVLKAKRSPFACKCY